MWRWKPRDRLLSDQVTLFFPSDPQWGFTCSFHTPIGSFVCLPCRRKCCVFAQILCVCANNLCEYCAKNLERRVTSSIIFPDVISHLSVSYVIAYAKFPLVIVRTRASVTQAAWCVECAEPGRGYGI